MTSQEILYIRLHNQLLNGHEMSEPHEVVAYMGAMQSQTFDIARWAIGVRLPGSTNRQIVEAINKAQIVRTHVLRPTWHFVAADDIHWMMDLSSPRLKPIYESYKRMSGVDDRLTTKAYPWLEKILRDGNHLTNKEIEDRLLSEGLQVDADVVSYILRKAELEAIVCNGRITGSKQTFCLLQERIPKRTVLSKEESLEKLARKFFTSHAPATIQDFIWWSGLTATDAKKGLEQIKHDFVCEEINGRTFWMRNDMQMPDFDADSCLLLPPFDEMVVSYKDRSDMIETEHYGKVMTKNGLFSPTIMWNGKIIGSWKKIMRKSKPEIELSFFEKTSQRKINLYNKPVKSLQNFLTK